MRRSVILKIMCVQATQISKMAFELEGGLNLLT